MAVFKNVSGGDREVAVDGRFVFVADADTFTIKDEFADALREQPFFEEQTSKTKKNPAADAAPIEGNN